MSHAKKHSILDTNDHGNGSLIASQTVEWNGAAFVGRSVKDTAAASSIALRTATGQVKVQDAVASNEAASLGQVQSLISTGILWKNPVSVIKIVDDSNMGGAKPVGATVGTSYVVNNWGDPAFSNGDIACLVSTGPDVWVKVVSQVAGFVPANTRVGVIGPTGSGLGAGSFTLKETQIGTADGAGAWTWETPADGWALVSIGEGEYYENSNFVFDTNNWVQISGAAPNHNVLPGLQGGGGGEYYHFTQNQAAVLVHMKKTFTLAGTEPTKNDMTTTGGYILDDRGMAVGTDGSIWFCYYNGVNGYAVQLGQTL